MSEQRIVITGEMQVNRFQNKVTLRIPMAVELARELDGQQFAKSSIETNIGEFLHNPGRQALESSGQKTGKRPYLHLVVEKEEEAVAG